ncbi:MAG: DUF2971 domain-containing protein [Bacteroidales bacterium]|nr:DUF2971 domain-containing protein [Bacteroidales bacterium]
MATIKITDKQLKDTLSLQLVNCNRLVNTLYKYMPASRILDILEKKPHQIGFVSPESWNDPYETIFLNTDYTALNGYKQPKIFCFCARMDNRNEEASWEIYKKENEPLLRLSIRTLGFLSSLDRFAKEHECDIYFSKVDYRLTTKEIKELYKPSSPYYHEFFDDFNDKQYVKVMSLKRWAFGYENEYRLFIIPQNQDAIKDYIKDGVLFIPIPIEMIIRFTFQPANKSDESLLSQIERVKYKAECKLIKERILASYSNAKFYKSILYSSVNKIEKIEI